MTSVALDAIYTAHPNETVGRKCVTTLVAVLYDRAIVGGNPIFFVFLSSARSKRRGRLFTPASGHAVTIWLGRMATNLARRHMIVSLVFSCWLWVVPWGVICLCRDLVVIFFAGDSAFKPTEQVSSTSTVDLTLIS